MACHAGLATTAEPATDQCCWCRDMSEGPFLNVTWTPHIVSYPKKMAKIKIALWVQQILSFNFLLVKRNAQKFWSDTLVSHSSSALNFSTHIYPSSPFFQEIWYSQVVNYLLEVIYNFMKKKDNFSFTVPKILCQQK